MLLLHTYGTTKIGEVRRYTVTYAPSHDRLLPLPTALHLRIKNTVALPFRAAYLHGPYTLYVSVRRQEFQPWVSETPGTAASAATEDEDDDWDREGIPVYDPHLKAGASFYATLPIPPALIAESLREFSETGDHARKSYEHGGKMSLDGKRVFGDEKKRRSVTWIVEVVSQVIFSTTASVGYEILLGRDKKCLGFGYPLGSGDGVATTEVQSRAVSVVLQGNTELWNLPPFPSWGLSSDEKAKDPDCQDEIRRKKCQRTRRVHLVILTHGIHSNTSADMLFMKEAIDEEERKAAAAREEQRRREFEEGKISREEMEADGDDDEQVIVRGFHDNCCRTERGIKYLGKRLACYVLHLAYPKRNPLPSKSPNKLQKPRKPHHHPHLTPDARETMSPMQQQHEELDVPPYKITSISFIGHSLGGLIQTYALAYIHVHSPTFFTEIKPVNFVALATPFLGLSNENPIYVRFALDFGLVGKTGQDLGLTWKAPNAFSVLAGNAAPGDHSSKPLLRILPTGPAHDVLRMFRNRTVYANVVNDGIVPLRTSCLLFLDWKGLGRVEKARRENGPMGGLVEWGWGQLVTNGPSTGVTSKVASSTPTTPGAFSLPSPFGTTSTFWGRNEPALEDVKPVAEAPHTSEPTVRELSNQQSISSLPTTSVSKAAPNPLTSLITLLRPQGSSSKKPASKIYHRSQTASSASSSNTTLSPPPPPHLEAPPRTSLLEATSDLLNPPLPTSEFIIDPSSRPRAIFHDRIYHSADIPRPTSRGLPVEEKIARAYHKDLSWRKVLVRLEPDAHNNMVVRRMFANAYGWPVVQHVVETHFGASTKALMPDDEEAGTENAPTPPGECSDQPMEVSPIPNAEAEPPTRGLWRRNQTMTTETSVGSWTSDAFVVSDESEEEGEGGEDVDSVLDGFLGLASQIPLPPPSPLGHGITGVSKVSAEGHGGNGRGTAGLGLGLRNLSFCSDGWGERRSGESAREPGRSEAVRMLERCSAVGGVTKQGSTASSVGRASEVQASMDAERQALLAEAAANDDVVSESP